MGYCAQGERRLEHGPDEKDENGKPEKTVGQDQIDVPGDVRALSSGNRHRFLDDAGDEPVALVGHDDLRIVVEDVRQPPPVGRHGLENGGPEISGLFQHPLLDDAVVFQELDGGPAQVVGKGRVEPSAQLPLQPCDERLDILAVLDPALPVGQIIGFGQVNGPFQQVVDAVVLVADGKHHRNVEQFGQLVGVDFDAAVPGHVGHVQGEHHPAVQFPDLGGQVKAPFQVGGIDDVDHHIGLFVQDVIPGDDFFDGKRGQAVGSGQVDNLQIEAVPVDPSLLFFDGDPRPVSDLLAGPGDVVEDGGFAGIGIARQGDGDLATGWVCR